MKTLKLWITILMLCMIVPAMAQDEETDGYVYQGNLDCQAKITLTVGDTDYPLTYRLTYHNGPVVEGTVMANEEVEFRLPRTRQWYQLFIGRDEVDEGLYALESSSGCNDSTSGDIFAPDPVLTEDEWSAARAILRQFIQRINAE